MQFKIKKMSINSKHIIIIGGGFAGMQAARNLKKSGFTVTVIDQHNYHTFQPLLYQVATSGLEPDAIAYPLRRVFRKNSNIRFKLAKVVNIDHEINTIATSAGNYQYDYLVIATGSTTNYFNLESRKDRLMTLKTIPDALNLRSWVLQNFEKAVLSNIRGKQKALLDIAIVGGGPTGVELAGALGEMRKYILPHDYPEIDFSMMSVNLYEALDRILPMMSLKATEKSTKFLKSLDVNIEVNSKVEDYDGTNLMFIGKEPLSTETVIWTAGVKSNPVPGLPENSLMKGGRILVDSFNRVKGLNNVFAIGDVAAMVSVELPKGHPMLAPVAIQQGKLLTKNLFRQSKNQQMKPFNYFDKGTMATIGRGKAVADIRRITLTGFFAWITWLFVHLMYLVGFRNKLLVLTSWIYNYLTYDKALRLIIRPYKRKVG